MAIEWNAENAGHLLRRATFSASPERVAQAVKQGLDQTLLQLFKPAPPAPKFPKKKIESLADLQTWWMGRMLKSKAPLTDKLTLFWHNHFATAISKVGSLEWMQNHVATLQAHALGDFRELVLAVAKDPAMLIWLDNVSNFADNPNENFARELMELFTTGVFDRDGQPNYTEQDVIEVARAFTGWTLSSGLFSFDAGGHDFGNKTVKGITGDLDGDDVIDILVNDAATARRIPAKLFAYFARPVDLDDPVLDDFEAAYVLSGGVIATVVETLFRHDAFYDEASRQGRIQSPAEFLVGALQLLGAKLKKGGKKDYPSGLGNRLQDLGQSLYDPPDVFGWDEGLAWVSASGLLARASAGDWIAEQRDPQDSQVRFHPEKLLPPKKQWKTLDAAGVVASVLARLGLPDASPGMVAALETYVATNDQGFVQPVVVDEEFVDEKVRGLLALILASPEYQLA